MLIASDRGIVFRERTDREIVVDPDGPFASYFAGVSIALPDGEGGIVFQADLPPPPFLPDSVLWLKAGTIEPALVLASEPDEEGTLDLLDAGIVDDRPSALVVVGSRIPHIDLLVVPLDGDPPTTILSTSASSHADQLISARFGGDVLALVWQSMATEGSWIELLDTRGDPADHLFNPVPGATGRQIVFADVSDAGDRLVYIATGTPGSRIITFDLRDGTELASIDTPPVEMNHPVRYDGNNRLVITRQSVYEDIDLTSGESTRPPHGGRTVAPTAAMSVAAGATLGSSAGWSCAHDDEVPKPPTGLPATVEERWTAIVTAARSCDLEALAVLRQPESQDEQQATVRGWLRQELLGGAPIRTLTRLLGTTPVRYPFGNESAWAWPAAVYPTPARWNQLTSVSGEMVDQSRPLYTGPTVGLTASGVWFEPVATDRMLPSAEPFWGWIWGGWAGELRIESAAGNTQYVQDPWYPSAVEGALSDLRGGLVFQYSALPKEGPPTVTPSAILRLAPGAQTPVVIVEPADGELLVLFEVSEIGGKPHLVYGSFSNWHRSPGSMGYDPGPHSLLVREIGSNTSRVVAQWDGAPGTPYLQAASYGDRRFVVTLRVWGEPCHWFEFIDDGPNLISRPVNPRPRDACGSGSNPLTEALWPSARWVHPTLSRDGTILVYQLDGRGPNAYDIVVHRVWGGGSERIDAAAFEAYDRAATLLFRTEGEDRRLARITHRGIGHERFSGYGFTILTVPLDLAPGAGLDAGVTGLPCSALGATDLMENPDLPAEVALTRSAIIEAASRCDFQALIDLGPSQISNPMQYELGCPAIPQSYQFPEHHLAHTLVKGDVYDDLLAIAVRALNQPYTVVDHGGGSTYEWRSGEVSAGEMTYDFELIITDTGDWLRFGAVGCPRT